MFNIKEIHKTHILFSNRIPEHTSWKYQEMTCVSIYVHICLYVIGRKIMGPQKVYTWKLWILYVIRRNFQMWFYLLKNSWLSKFYYLNLLYLFVGWIKDIKHPRQALFNSDIPFVPLFPFYFEIRSHWFVHVAFNFLYI